MCMIFIGRTNAFSYSNNNINIQRRREKLNISIDSAHGLLTIFPDESQACAAFHSAPEIRKFFGNPKARVLWGVVDEIFWDRALFGSDFLLPLAPSCSARSTFHVIQKDKVVSQWFTCAPQCILGFSASCGSVSQFSAQKRWRRGKAEQRWPAIGRD